MDRYREYNIQALKEEVRARENVIRSLEQAIQSYPEWSREGSLLQGCLLDVRWSLQVTAEKLRRMRGW